MKRNRNKLLLCITLAAFALTSTNAVYYLHLPCDVSKFCQSKHNDNSDHNSNSKHDPNNCPVCQHFLYHSGSIVIESTFSISFADIYIGITPDSNSIYDSQALCITRSRSPPFSHFI